jgi:hypothetical protein
MIKAIIIPKQAKDHETVRVLDSHPKVVPWKIKIEFCAVLGLPSIVERKYATELSPNASLLSSCSCVRFYTLSYNISRVVGL